MLTRLTPPLPRFARALAWGALAIGAVWLSSAIAQQAPGSTNCPGVARQRADWIVRVECDGSGKPLFVEHKWPLGSPDNIGRVRVPWGYRDLLFGPSVGAQLTNNGHRPSLEQGYGGFFIWALLPGVTPHDQRVPPVQDKVKEFDLLTVMVSPPAPSFVAAWTPEEWMRRRRASLVQDLNIGPKYRDIKVVSKEPRFGLNRIGPERVVVDPNYDKEPLKPGPPPYDDLWFDGDTIETSTVIIICGSDYLRNGERDPDDNPLTLCEHRFGHAGLNSGVRLVYWKKHLFRWRDTQDRTAALLNSFKTDPKPRN